MMPNRISKETQIKASSTDAGQTVVAGQQEDVRICSAGNCCNRFVKRGSDGHALQPVKCTKCGSKNVFKVTPVG